MSRKVAVDSVSRVDYKYESSQSSTSRRLVWTSRHVRVEQLKKLGEYKYDGSSRVRRDLILSFLSSSFFLACCWCCSASLLEDCSCCSACCWCCSACCWCCSACCCLVVLPCLLLVAGAARLSVFQFPGPEVWATMSTTPEIVLYTVLVYLYSVILHTTTRYY